MSQRKLPVLITLAAMLAIAAGSAFAEEPVDREAAEKAIHAAAEQYIHALQSGDKQAMLAMWAEGGDVVDALGRSRPASEVVPQEAAARVEAAGNQGVSPASRKLVDNSIRFITDDVAIEDGKVEVTATGGEPRLGRFTAIWVQQDGKWLLASLREVRLDQLPAESLSGLDWMVGTWEGESNGAKFKVTANWNPKHTFLIRDLEVSIDDKMVVNGQQRIGIDPADGQIRSWMHDHDGGHGEGVWAQHGDSWVVQASGVTPDGRHTTGTNIYRPEGKDSFLWKSIGATAGGKAMPDFEITLKRTGAAENDK